MIAFPDWYFVPSGTGKRAGPGQGRRQRRQGRCSRGRWDAAGILEGGPQVAAPGGRRGGGRGGLGARRAVTAARRGGASRQPAGSHGERPHGGTRIRARVRCSPVRRPGVHPAALPAGREPLTPAHHKRGARGSPRTPTTPASRNPGPEPGSARSAGARQPEESPKPDPTACAPVPPGRLLRRKPGPPGGGAGPRTARRRRPGEPSAGAAPRRRPPGRRLLPDRAPGAPRGSVRPHCSTQRQHHLGAR
ncbi:uncharacterized protein [Manis javanica]|uniref:uncharacterized protein isoform X2 n=1 Tax=Manis javanica TaxID=9974 RepID=UPI0018799C55|nr:translation initiation factor IF-2-like [Manis javanica]